MKKVVFVCLGNICRSPMAEALMQEQVGSEPILVESRATSSWEHGNPIHEGTQRTLRRHGIAYKSQKTSQQISLEDLETFDLILGMDDQNVRDLKALSQGKYDHKIHLFIEGGVPDPWYTGDFEETYDLVSRGCRTWYERMK